MCRRLERGTRRKGKWRLREVERLAPPPPLPWKWDASLDAATNMWNKKVYEAEAQRRGDVWWNKLQ